MADYFNQESERLIYRKATKNDIPSWVEFFENNDRFRYLGIDLNKSNEELAKVWILKQLERYEVQGLGHLIIELKETGEFIGMGGILPRELNGRNEYEIAYSLKPKFWGNGYATEMAHQMKLFGSQNLETDRFISIIDVNNHDSVKVAKRNGMHILFRTEYLGLDVNVYGIDIKAIKQTP